MNDLLKDLTVIELASVLAGPAVGVFFSELGARVIKVENNRTGGDVTRGWKLPGEPQQRATSAYYESINWNKQALMLDLTAEEDQVKVHELIREADIVISNYKEASAQRMRVDYETLKSINPQIIFGQIYAFGKDYDRPAFDMVLQAEAGFLYMTGEPGGSPVKMPVALIDLLAAHQLKEGILLALLKKERGGGGSLISVSLLDAAIASLANQATNWLIAGHIPEPMGTGHPNIAPYGDVFSCKDGKLIVVAAGTEKQFRQLCRAMNIPALLQDDRFLKNTDRVAHRKELWDALQAVFVKFPRTEAAALLEDHQVPYGSILNMKEVFEKPQAQALLLENQAPDGGLLRRVRTVVFKLQ